MEEEKPEEITTKPAVVKPDAPEVAQPTIISNIQKRGKLIITAVATLLVFVVAVLLLSSSRSNKNMGIGKAPPPEPENVLLATVGDRKIYRDDVKTIALEQYLSSAVTNDVIKALLDTAVERAILDSEAKKKAISIPKQTSLSVYYSLLKEKVTEGQILAITEQDINWWIPPVPYEQRPEFEVQRQNQEAMASEIEKRFRNGEDPYAVAKDTVTKYPMFGQTLGYNGANISKSSTSITSGDRILNYDSSDSAKPFFKMMYKMNSGQIQKGIWTDGSGGAVIKVKSVSRGKSIDYNTWLADKVKKEVVFNAEEIKKL